MSVYFCASQMGQDIKAVCAEYLFMQQRLCWCGSEWLWILLCYWSFAEFVLFLPSNFHSQPMGELEIDTYENNAAYCQEHELYAACDEPDAP